MDPLVEHRATIDAFLEVARRYCVEIEASKEVPDIELLRKLHLILSELYWRGQMLPEVDPWPDEDDDESFDIKPYDLSAGSEKNSGRYYFARSLLDEKLAHKDYHRLVFDPYSPKDDMREAVTASLSDHLGDIYAGIQDLFDRQQVEDPIEWVWHARFEITNIWGLMDILPAVNALSWLVSHYWDEYEERWEEIWAPPPGGSQCEI